MSISEEIDGKLEKKSTTSTHEKSINTVRYKSPIRTFHYAKNTTPRKKRSSSKWKSTSNNKVVILPDSIEGFYEEKGKFY